MEEQDRKARWWLKRTRALRTHVSASVRRVRRKALEWARIMREHVSGLVRSVRWWLLTFTRVVRKHAPAFVRRVGQKVLRLLKRPWLSWTLLVLTAVWLLFPSYVQEIAGTLFTLLARTLDWLMRDARTAQLKADDVRNLVLGVFSVTGLTVGILGYLLARHRLNNDTQRLDTEEKKRDDERYARAVEMLGHDRSTVRLGGIFELMRLGLTGDNHHKQALDSLGGFMRDHCAINQQNTPDKEDTNTPQATEDEGRAANTAPVLCTQDIQEALTAYGTLLRAWDQKGERKEAGTLVRRLSELNLAKFDRPDPLYLYRCDLNRSNLSHAKLVKAELARAYLNNAILSGAHLDRANLSDAYLNNAILSGARLWDAILSGAHLTRANLTGALLKGVNLTGAHLSEANLTGASLSEANLTGALLRGTNLSDALLWEANLTGARLWDANLSGAYLWETKLIGATITLEWDKENDECNPKLDRSRFLREQARSLHKLGWPVLDRSKMLFFKTSEDASEGETPLSEAEVRKELGLPPEPEGKG